MGTLGLVTVLVGNIFDFVGLAIIADIFEGALHSDGFIFGANVFQVTGLMGTSAIAGFETVIEKQALEDVFPKKKYRHLLTRI